MAFSTLPPPRDNWPWVVRLLPAALAVAFFAFGLAYPDHLSADGVVYEAIARHLTANTTLGRQALVASAWWPPFPTLLRLPFTAMATLPGIWPIPSLLLSSAAAAWVVSLLIRRFQQWGLRGGHTWIAPVIIAQPFFLEQTLGGGLGPLIGLFALHATDGLAEWTERRRLRALVRLAAGSAMLIGSSLEMVPWVAGLYFCLFFDLVCGAFPRGQRAAVLWLALLPPVAVAGFWFLLNWLIMGDAIYFLRGVLRHRELLSRPIVAPFPFSPMDALAVIIALLSATAAAWRGRRAGVFLGLLAAAPVGMAAILNLRGLLGSPTPLLFVAAPLTVFAVAYHARDNAHRVLARTVAWIAALALTLGAIARLPERSLFAPERASYAALATQRGHWLPCLESHVRLLSPFSVVFVAGYDSLALLGPHPPPMFVSTLDFDFAAAERDYEGNRLFLLVRRPEGRGAMDSIHWKFPRIYERGTRYTLYDSDWGDWRLFEIVQLRPMEKAP